MTDSEFKELRELEAKALANNLEASKNRKLMLRVPEASIRKRMVERIDYSYSKDVLEHSFGPLLNKIKSGQIVLSFYGVHPDDRWHENILRSIRARAGVPLKSSYCELVTILTYTFVNMVGWIDISASKNEKELITDVCGRGMMCLDNIIKHDGFRDMKMLRSWELMSGYGTWYSSSNTRVLSFAGYFTEAIDPSEGKKGWSWYPTKSFYVPFPTLIYYWLLKKGASRMEVATVDRLDGKYAENVYYSKSLGESLSILDGMLYSGEVRNGKTKLGINALKKLKAALPAMELPEFSDFDNNMPVDIIGNLAVLAYERRESEVFPYPRQRFLKDMVMIWMDCPQQLIDMWLLNSARIPSAYRSLGQSILRTVAASIKSVLHVNAMLHSGKWVDYTSFKECIELELVSDNVPLFFPKTQDEGIDRVKDPDGMPISPENYKMRFHDVAVDGMMLSLLALGMIEAASDATGRIRYFRITETGEYAFGFIDKVPENLDFDDTDNDFELDENTGVIFIKNPKTVYLPVIAGLASKISLNRYVIDEKSIMKDCKTGAALDERITQIRSLFKIEKNGPLDMLLSRLLKRCDVVHPTPGGTTYRLYDIDPTATDLLRRIAGDSQIMDNAMRVEGSRLLIKTSFFSSFVAKLRSWGYIVDA